MKTFFSLKDFDVRNKRVLVRVDYNVPLKDGRVANDNRIRASLPTINYLLDNHAKIILVTHIGRPDGKPDNALKTDAVAEQLSALIGRSVKKSDSSLDRVRGEVEKLGPGEILMLENIRFWPEEERNDRDFGRKLASLAELYVNDAFAVCHRDNASVSAITEFLPSCAGLLLERELTTLGNLLESPERPFYAVIGGAKLETKIPVIESLAKRTDKILVGGAMIFSFFRALGYETGKSLVGEKEIPLAKTLIESYRDKIMLPVDVVLDDLTSVNVKSIPGDAAALDIGIRTVRTFASTLADAKTVVWNGPLGKFEQKPFDSGTMTLAKIIGGLQATTVVGGGETVQALEEAGLADKFTLVSTGGGACLEFLEGKELPAIAALKRNYLRHQH
jgi:phosphoglycerate kinase